MFIKQKIKLHSGQISDFKIECDDLKYQDYETLAYLISKRYYFNSVYGIPKGGDRLAMHLSGYINPDGTDILIVDDVLTTGDSMEDAKSRLTPKATSRDSFKGIVIFARGPCPYWVKSIFQMWH